MPEQVAAYVAANNLLLSLVKFRLAGFRTVEDVIAYQMGVVYLAILVMSI